MKWLTVPVFALAGTLLLGTSASAEPIHRCEGHVDYACIDRSGAFCTLWLGNGCSIGT